MNDIRRRSRLRAHMIDMNDIRGRSSKEQLKAHNSTLHLVDEDAVDRALAAPPPPPPPPAHER